MHCRRCATAAPPRLRGDRTSPRAASISEPRSRHPCRYPERSEVMQHRSGRTAARVGKGVSVCWCAGTQAGRAECSESRGIDAGSGARRRRPRNPKARSGSAMLKDALFAEETTRRICCCAGPARPSDRPRISRCPCALYRARLPSPEDIIDPGGHRSRPREIAAGNGIGARKRRGSQRRTTIEPRNPSSKPSARHVMGEGGVWFRASYRSRKNAERAGCCR